MSNHYKVLIDLGDIYLRRFIYEDMRQMTEMMTDEETTKYVSNRKPWSPKRVYDFIKWNIENADDTYYAIIRKSDDAFIGYTGHKKYTFKRNTLYNRDVFTIVIRDKGKGYGKRVTSAYIEHTKRCGIYLYATVDHDNAASNALFTSLGYKPEITMLIDNVQTNIYFLFDT